MKICFQVEFEHLWTQGLKNYIESVLCCAHLIKSFANFRSEWLFEFVRSNRSAFEIPDVDDYNISETITTTKTSFVPVGSVTLELT